MNCLVIEINKRELNDENIYFVIESIKKLTLFPSNGSCFRVCGDRQLLAAYRRLLHS